MRLGNIHDYVCERTQSYTIPDITGQPQHLFAVPHPAVFARNMSVMRGCCWGCYNHSTWLTMLLDGNPLSVHELYGFITPPHQEFSNFDTHTCA